MNKFLTMGLSALTCLFWLPVLAVAQTETPSAGETETPAKIEIDQVEEPTDADAGGDVIVPSELVLPASTRGWISVPDSDALKAAIESTQFGQMMEDPAVKPFVEDLVKQFRAWLDKENIRFGMTVEDIENVKTGEICLAGVLNEQSGEGDSLVDHAVVLLVDVSESKDRAEELLVKVAEELTSREATREDIEINGVAAAKWAFKKPRGLRKKQYAYHAIVGKWLLACDNEAVFRDVVQRIGKAAEAAPTLSENPAFATIHERCQFDQEGYPSHLRWFIEPFGYIELAQAIADAQTPGEGLRNDYAEKFHDEGFSAIKGVGGVVSVATGKHEAVHRTFVYAPPVLDGDERYNSAAAMLDFRNLEGDVLDPPMWVPAGAAGVVNFTWDLSKALQKVGSIIDATAGTPGSFQRALDGLRDDVNGPMVDVRLLVSRLNNRITVTSVTQQPITEESERIVFGIRIVDGHEEYVADSIHSLVHGDADETIEYNGATILVVDTAEEDDFGDLELELEAEFADPLADVAEEEEEEFQKPKPLFEKRVFVVKGGFLLIGNNVEQVKSVVDGMSSQPGLELAQAEDYLAVSDALADLAGDAAPSFRHFGRLDLTLRTNYEMMRLGRMPQSKTLLAEILNRAYTPEDADNDFVRDQHIAGDKMPADYDEHVAKYLGPTGMVVHSLDDGWLITGCVLKKPGTVSELSTGTEAEQVEEEKADQPEEEVASDNETTTNRRE